MKSLRNVFALGDELHVIMPLGVSPFEIAREQGPYVFTDSWGSCKPLTVDPEGDPRSSDLARSKFNHFLFLACGSASLTKVRHLISPQAFHRTSEHPEHPKCHVRSIIRRGPKSLQD